MKYVFGLLMMIQMNATQEIFDFNTDSNINDWLILDDVVMGGKSSGSFSLNKDGHGVFEGKVSLENNGGFSSLRYRFNQKSIKDKTKLTIRVKGDAKKYQIRLKPKASNYYSYIYTFETSGDWEEIQIPLADMYPSFRGRRLDLPNFSANSIEELAFLIGNKQPEDFRLMIDRIAVN